MGDTHCGGCLCGGVRFEVTAEPGGAAICHCTDCRRITGSAFNISLPVTLADFRITAGAPKAYATIADSGNALTRYFCPDCGSPLYTASPVHPDTVYVKAGAFDEPDLVKPHHQSWMRSRVPWADIPADLASHSRGSRDPED